MIRFFLLFFISFSLLTIITLCSYHETEAISFDHCNKAFHYTAKSYYKSQVDLGFLRTAFQFARAQANLPNPDPFFISELIKHYREGKVTKKNEARADHLQTTLDQMRGDHSER